MSEFEPKNSTADEIQAWLDGKNNILTAYDLALKQYQNGEVGYGEYLQALRRKLEITENTGEPNRSC